MKFLWSLAVAATTAHAYWLMGIEDFITTERLDPVVSPGKVSGHVHSVLGGSNFRMNTNTSFLRQSECSSIPIPQDKSNYWFPHLYFQWKNGSFTSLNGGAVIYYLFSDTPGTTTAFPDDFRMLSGDPTLRTYNASSFAQQAVTFLCLDFDGVSTKHNELPSGTCPSGVRAQINFPSCWDGKNTDSPDHKSHVAFLSGGPDSGTCSDPKYPVTLPRIFLELYWSTGDFDNVRSQAMNSTQPFVFSYGDTTGYGYHADFINGWDAGVLQKAVDNCHCNPFGDATCCVNQGIFDMNQGKSCRITKTVDEQTTGTLSKLPGNNPVQPAGKQAVMFAPDSIPALLSPVYAYTGDSPPATGTVVVPAQTLVPGSSATATPTTVSSPSTAVPLSSAPTAAPTTSVGTSITSSVSGSQSSHASIPTSSLTTSKTTTTHVLPTFSLPSLSLPSIPGISLPTLSIPIPTLGHVLSPSTSIVAPAAQASSMAAAAAASPVSHSSSPLAVGSKTCSSKKRRNMEQHRRHNLHHVRHLDYVYDTN